jgi:hypothetical protein
MALQSECMVRFKNINLVKVLQGSLIVFQNPFDIYTTLQSEYVVWFKKISLFKVLQSSSTIFQHHFDICTIFQNEYMFGSRTSTLQRSFKVL